MVHATLFSRVKSYHFFGTKKYSRTGHECPSRHVFLSHTSRTSWVISHIPIERGVSCGHSQVLFINFGVRTQKIRRASLNGQIVSEFVPGCLNLNLNFRLYFKYVSEHDVGFSNHYCRPHNSSWIKSYYLIPFKDTTIDYQPGSGQRFVWTVFSSEFGR